MAARPPRAERRRRPRGGTLERPVNARMYRGTWLLVGIPLLLASLGIGSATPLPRPALPPTFDRDVAVDLTRQLATEHPNRAPGTAEAERATSWVAERLRAVGLRAERSPFTAQIPGRGEVRLVNLVARVPGRSPEAVVVMAHRDNTGVSPGANDNASGTAALIELARSYAFLTADAADTGGATIEPPPHTLVFVSTDGGAYGGLGAAHFASRPAYRDRIAAVLVLDAVGGTGRPRLQLAGDAPRSPPPRLVESLAVRVLEESGRRPGRPSLLDQLSDLAMPLSFYEQAPLVGSGIPAVTLTTASDAAPADFGDSAALLTAPRLGALGRAAQLLVGGLEQGVEFEPSTAANVYLGGGRVVGGWSIQLILIAALSAVPRRGRRPLRTLPPPPSRTRPCARQLWTPPCLLARPRRDICRLRRARRLAGGQPAPARAEQPDALGEWPLVALAGLAVIAGGAWLVVREGLLPRGPVRDEEELGGYAAALLVLGVLALVVVALNVYALLLLLPSLHAWLWLPHVRTRRLWIRVAVLALGFAGPLFLLASLAGRFGLGSDAPWYLLTLVAIGYIGPAAVVVALAWAAAAAQLTAAVAHRYAPAASRGEQARRPGAGRRLARAIARRRRRRAHDAELESEDVAAER